MMKKAKKTMKKRIFMYFGQVQDDLARLKGLAGL